MAGGGAALLATGSACARRAPTAVGGKARPTLRIAQWRHAIPTYDAWFDNEFAKRWGDAHDVDVVVDHIDLAEVPARAEAEVAARGSHDIFGFVYPPPSFEDEVIDHRELVEEVQAKLGTLTPVVERSIVNPKTKKYFGFCDGWAADPVNYRADLWEQAHAGGTPDTWEHVLQDAPKLKALGHPLGIGMSQEIDSNLILMDLMHSFGASIQDEESALTINRPATVDAVKLGAALYRAGMTDDMFNWDPYSNNRFLAAGTGSFILNAISAVRTIEGQLPELAPNVRLLPPPAGPAARLGLPHVVSIYVIWKFSEHQEEAKRFLVDLALSGRDAFIQSGFYNLPAFAGGVPDLDRLVSNDEHAQPPDKYSLLRDAASWSTNLGHPGHAHAAMEEVFNRFIIPKMFAAAARGETTAADAVAAAEVEIKRIFDKWREQGKV
jgi:multiple sugar transport system substrate-binding protein